MKKYVKPALAALALEADTVLCASNCTANKENNDFVKMLIEWYGDVDWSTYFASNEDCKDDPEDIGIKVDGYCKFTATDMIFIS